jgi:tetratricopeptide (TPR) repeat protein
MNRKVYMKKEDNPDVVIFPGWKKQLEVDGLLALKEKRYEEALKNFEKLEEFDAANYEILTGKVIVYIELGRYEEAITICQQLMRVDDGNYFKYLHIYVTILFQTSQYDEIVSLLDEIFTNEEIPPTYREQFTQIYDLSKKLDEEQEEQQSHEDIQQFIHILDSGTFQEQWSLLSKVRRRLIQKEVSKIIPFFKDPELTPVMKTGILQWFIEQKVNRNIEVKKWNLNKVVNPANLKDVMDSSFAKQVLIYLQDIEQEDPTLFEIIRQILYRFLYVYFPFTPDDLDLTYIREAVLVLGLEYLSLDEYHELLIENDDRREEWVKKIRDLEKRYFSQIE